MATSAKPSAPHVKYDALAAFLSYLVPGLGQIYQGRIIKGVLFMAALYSLFFYGMALGSWNNVYLPPNVDRKLPDGTIVRKKNVDYAMIALPYFGQFWIGVAAWPALWQHARYDADMDRDAMLGTFQRMPKEEDLNDIIRAGDKRWDLGLVYTIVAGVLNILVIYDALAGAAFRPEEKSTTTAKPEAA